MHFPQVTYLHVAARVILDKYVFYNDISNGYIRLKTRLVT